MSNDLRVLLAISEYEARAGTARVQPCYYQKYSFKNFVVLLL